MGMYENYQAFLVENNNLKIENSNLKIENKNLKEEIKSLKAQIGVAELQVISSNISNHKPEAEVLNQESAGQVLTSNINSMSDSIIKIKLFMSLFRGRDDVYAKRWVNKKGTTGYSPVCANEWKPGICKKAKTKCADCKYRVYLSLDEKVINAHLRGKDPGGQDNFVAVIYPMCLDETCYFLAIDFDDEGWQKDITTLREVCSEFKIPIAVERSRSGNGAHVWFFFESPIAASQARKFGSALLTCAMSKRHEINFKSYDRFFPNQDTMPKGGLGHLIALPLQKAARKDNNSVFIDDDFQPFDDQWAFLASIHKYSEDEIEILISKLCQGNELGTLKKDEEETQKPWETNRIKLLKDDFPKNIEIVKANMLFIPKAGISQRALNHLKRLAAFKNPEFYKAQAMRMPTFSIPRIISCTDETEEYLCLPRGCEEDLKSIFGELAIEVRWIDKTSYGRKIDVEFNGSLREEQPLAFNKLLKYDNGILCGTTAFGKTVVAIKLIAEKKVNTLILVDKVSLVSQWKESLLKFLTINETLRTADISEGKKRGRKKNRSIIGQMGHGKNALSGIVDIAIMQSLNRMGEVKECVKDYGMVIVDECHHVSAFSFEKVLKSTDAKYIYGLTATPTRKDGHHPIIFMQCGSIRYRDDAKKQAEKRPFEHFVIPRFTSLRVPLDKDEKDVSINELYAEIVLNEMRNQIIVDDVVKCYENGKSRRYFGIM